MLAGGAVLEIASLAMPASRAVMPMLERGAFQLGKATFSKMGQKSLFQQANKTTAVAVEKKIAGNIIKKDTTRNTRFISTPEGYVHDLKPTFDRIASNKAFPHRNDGAIFKNLPPKGQMKSLLPAKPQGYYREYVHPTPGGNSPGAMRIVTGQNGEIWFTPDHYRTFIPIK